MERPPTHLTNTGVRFLKLTTANCRTHKQA